MSMDADDVQSPSGSRWHRAVQLALWQGALRRGGAWPAELQSCARAAKAQGAELLLTPELCLPGFHCFGSDGFLDSPEVVEGTLARIAQEEGIALCVGYAERRQTGLEGFWNTAVLLDARGKVCLRYRKHHLWGNEANLGLVASDEPLQVVELELLGPPEPCRIRVSMLVCYDVEFPEMVRILACPPHRVELLLVPTAMPYTDPNVPLKVVPTRAMENRIFVAYCNYPCTARVDNESFCGHSLAAGPDGDTWAGPADWHEERLVHCRLGWSADARWKAKDAPYLRDRRPQFYRSQGHCQEEDLPEESP